MMTDHHILASDQDRDDAAVVLAEAYAAGRLTRDELGQRAAAVYAARTWGELGALTGDLPAGPLFPAARHPPSGCRRRRAGEPATARLRIITRVAWILVVAATVGLAGLSVPVGLWVAAVLIPATVLLPPAIGISGALRQSRQNAAGTWPAPGRSGTPTRRHGTGPRLPCSRDRLVAPWTRSLMSWYDIKRGAWRAVGIGGGTLSIAPCRQHPDVRTRFGGDAATVILGGELDIRTAPVVQRALTDVLEQGPERLVLDLTEVTFIDCASTRMLAATSRALPGTRKAVIRRPSRAVRRVLELTGMSACFWIERSVPSSLPSPRLHAAEAHPVR